MFNFNFDALQPPFEILSQCQVVLLTDEQIKNHGCAPYHIKKWARENCKSFVWMNEQDVSDNSLVWDYIYGFYFYEEKDANWFQLKWK